MPDQPQNVYSAQPTPAAPPAVVPPPKREFPKILLFVGLGVILVLLVVLGIRIFSGVRRGTEIVWWGLWEDDSVISPLIAEYEKKSPGAKIKYVRQSKEDYRERLTNSLAKGEGPDIFRFHNSWVPMFRRELDKVPASVFTSADFVKTFYPIAASDLAGSSGFLGIPLEYDGLTLFINEDIFSQAGKSPPTTWNELRSLAKDLTRKDDQGAIIQSGVALGRTENVDHWPEILGLMMLQNGVKLSNPKGKIAEDALKFYTIFSSVDGVWDATLPVSTAAFAGGKLAMYFGPSWEAFEIRAKNPNLKFKAVILPQLPKGNPNEPDVSYASYWVEGVWSRSKFKKEAWDFLKFLSSRDSLEKLYQNESQLRTFGEPYPRMDMADLLAGHPIVGSIIIQARDAQSWYLQSRTFDGPTGINSQINKYFEDAVNAVNSGIPPEKALEPVVAGVAQVLRQYGLISR